MMFIEGKYIQIIYNQSDFKKMIFLDSAVLANGLALLSC